MGFLRLICRESKQSTGCGRCGSPTQQTNKRSKKGFVETLGVFFWRGIYVDFPRRQQQSKQLPGLMALLYTGTRYQLLSQKLN